MKEIYKKLLAIQQALRAPKNQRNEFNNFNYRSAEDILEAVKPLLAEQGLTLVLSDSMEYIGDRYYIKATATLSDGEEEIVASAYAREDESRAGMSESQVTGCSSSYARKYCLNGLFLIDDGRDSDSFDNRKQKRKPERQDVSESDKTSIPQPTDNLSVLREYCKMRIKEEPDNKDEITKFGTYYAGKLPTWDGPFQINRLYDSWMNKRRS